MTKLQEHIPFKFNVLESKGKTKKPGVLMVLEGVVQRADTKNANGRVYPKPLWQKVMTDEDVNSRISSRRMLGELDHPSSGATSLSRVSHVITKHDLKPNGEVRGVVEVLDTPSGQIAATLFEAGVELGISSRGDGSVESKGDIDEVQDDFRLETYDLVLKPSTPGAHPQVVESEQKNYNKMIATAVRGLVENTSDSSVLIECHKIVSVLETTDAEDILSDINDRLEVVDHDGNTGKDAEMTISTPVPAAPQLTPETATILKTLVDQGVQEAVSEKEAEIVKLQEQVANLDAERSSLAEQLGAAERLIESFKEKVDTLSESNTDVADTQKRLDAAKALLEEALDQLEEHGETKKRLEAAEALLNASISTHKESAIANAIDSCVEGIEDEDKRSAIVDILEGCTTPDAVKAKFDSLSTLIESAERQAPVREPLPQQGGQLNENKQDSKPTAQGALHSDPVTSLILQRLG